MKRFLAIALLLTVLTVALVACRTPDAPPEEPTPDVEDSGSDSGSDKQTEEIEYISTKVKKTESRMEPWELPEVPVLPNGQLPEANQ